MADLKASWKVVMKVVQMVALMAAMTAVDSARLTVVRKVEPWAAWSDDQ